MRFILSMFLLAFAVPTYICTTRYIEFGTWRSDILLSIAAIAVWYSGMLVMRHFDTKRLKLADAIERQSQTNLEILSGSARARKAAK